MRSAVRMSAGETPRQERGTEMGSSGKRKTTFAKLARESKLRERRLEKQAKRDARKQRASENQPNQVDDAPAGEERR
jgi:hypothetical protein